MEQQTWPPGFNIMSFKAQDFSGQGIGQLNTAVPPDKGGKIDFIPGVTKYREKPQFFCPLVSSEDSFFLSGCVSRKEIT